MSATGILSPTYHASLIVETPIAAARRECRCPKCGPGWMVAQVCVERHGWLHICNHCGTSVWLAERFPRVVHHG